MAPLYIPNYMSFHNGNTFLGSYKGMRFKLTPNVQEETIRAEYWYGPLCYEKSEMDGDETFPLSENGIQDLAARVEALAAQVPQK